MILWAFAWACAHIVSLRGFWSLSLSPWAWAFCTSSCFKSAARPGSQLGSKQQIWVAMMTAAYHSHATTAGPLAGHLGCQHRWGVVPGGGSCGGPSLAVEHHERVGFPSSVGWRLLRTKTSSWLEVNLELKGLGLPSCTWNLWCETINPWNKAKGIAHISMA